MKVLRDPSDGMFRTEHKVVLGRRLQRRIQSLDWELDNDFLSFEEERQEIELQRLRQTGLDGCSNIFFGADTAPI